MPKGVVENIYSGKYLTEGRGSKILLLGTLSQPFSSNVALEWLFTVCVFSRLIANKFAYFSISDTSSPEVVQ